MRHVIKSHEVAILLGLTPEGFNKKREALEKEGFPKPLPVVGGWSRYQVIAWIDGLDPQPEQFLPSGGELAAGLSEARRRLDRALNGAAS